MTVQLHPRDECQWRDESDFRFWPRFSSIRKGVVPVRGYHVPCGSVGLYPWQVDLRVDHPSSRSKDNTPVGKFTFDVGSIS